MMQKLRVKTMMNTPIDDLQIEVAFQMPVQNQAPDMTSMGGRFPSLAHSIIQNLAH